MGFNDRDYAREGEGGFTFGRDWSVVTWVIVLNLGIYVLQILTNKSPDGRDPFTDFLALRANLFTFELVTHPWQILEIVTYGFTHDPENILHIAFNLFFFWMFGREIEARYGGPTFAKMYLTAIIFAGLGWLLIENIMHFGSQATIIGASGGVSAVIALFVLLFPKRTVLFWGIFPLPIWAFGLVWIFMDIRGALTRDDASNVAFTAHLAGAAYGFLYFKTNWTLGSLWPSSAKFSRMRAPKLKVHDPDEVEENFSEQVDEILKKIQDHGQDSLTAKERKILEQASRRYQQKHR
jgi:membrane associated rhomboid family serine protease